MFKFFGKFWYGVIVSLFLGWIWHHTHVILYLNETCKIPKAKAKTRLHLCSLIWFFVVCQHNIRILHSCLYMLQDTVNVLKFLVFYSILFWLKICFFKHLFLKILSGMANSVDSDQTAASGAVWSRSALFAYAILSKTGVRNLRTFTVLFLT